MNQSLLIWSPRTAGPSGDGYIWKYLYTIKPTEIVKFDTVDFIPVPKDWDNNAETSAVKGNAVDGSVKIVVIKDRGVGVGTANRTYTRVPIKGDGTGAECTVVINNDQKVESITISNQGSGYTFGNVDLSAGGIPDADTEPVLDVIMTPSGGHGADIYKELGASNVLMYARIENDVENPDFITGNEIARIGLVENPLIFGSSTKLTSEKASAVYAMRLGLELDIVLQDLLQTLLLPKQQEQVLPQLVES